LVPITELRIEGLRTIERVRLRLDGLTVLIGENGSGKSSIIEACEILHRATGSRFMEELYSIHGGLSSLLRQGAPRLLLGVTVRPVLDIYDERQAEDTARHKHIDCIEYDLALTPGASFATIEETLRVTTLSGRQRHSSGPPRRVSKAPKSKAATRAEEIVPSVKRVGAKIDMLSEGQPSSDNIDERVPFMATIDRHSNDGSPQHEAQYVAAHLGNLQVHLPFEVTPSWAARGLDRKSALRAPGLLSPADHLEQLGVNLVNAFHALRNDFGPDHWNETLDYIRLGIGEGVEDVNTWVEPDGGHIGFTIKQRGLSRPLPVSQLSGGMLAYLAFVALFRLWATQPALLALDEPDVHLHPRLLMRVLDFFESMARDFPVLIATHSDRLIEGLTDPVRAVVLCELDERLATRLIRPDRAALGKWLQRYRALGELRGTGLLASVLTRTDLS
jgi:predicted ATPase